MAADLIEKGLWADLAKHADKITIAAEGCDLGEAIHHLVLVRDYVDRLDALLRLRRERSKRSRR